MDKETNEETFPARLMEAIDDLVIARVCQMSSHGENNPAFYNIVEGRRNHLAQLLREGCLS